MPAAELQIGNDPAPPTTTPGYSLPGGHELTTLEQEIITAMAPGNVITVMLAESPTGKGVLALSGASLAYAVPGPPAAPVGPA